MTTSRATLLTLIAAVVALGLGAAAGMARRYPKSAGHVGPVSPRTSAVATGPVDQRREREEVLDGETAKLMKSGSGSKRWLHMLLLAENAAPGDIPELLRAAEGDRAMIRILAARWAELDPKHMLFWLYSEDRVPEGTEAALPARAILTSVLLEEWAKSDMRAVIKALTDVPDFSGRGSMRLTTLTNSCEAMWRRGFER